MEHLAPASTDQEGWARAVSEGHFCRYRLEAIVAAIQDLPSANDSVRNPLTKHLSDSVLRILRARVSLRHPNRGRDIIEATHAHIIEAVLQPESADGKALRAAFFPRVSFRLRDALASDVRASGNLNIRQWKSDTLMCDISDRNEPSNDFDENIDVEEILEHIPNDGKRQAFRLFMDGVPFKSKNPPSIVDSLGICETTARAWVKKVQKLLASDPTVQEMLKAKTRGEE